jgi:hypothetical protein
LTAVLAHGLAAAVSAQDAGRAATEPTDADVRRLLEVSGAADIGNQVLTTLTASMRKAYPDVPDAVWNDLVAELRSVDLVEMTIPIYRKYMTADDVRGLLAFHETPLGRKMLRVQPLIMRDSMEVGQKWGQQSTQRVLKRLQEKGYVRKPTAE